MKVHTHGFTVLRRWYCQQVSVCQAVTTVGKILSSALDDDEAQASANIIVAHVLGFKTLHSVHCSALTLSQKQWDQVMVYTEARKNRMPVQYVIGEWDFLDLTLKMKPPILIPRPETEELVKLVQADPVFEKAGRFLDIGSGSGAISVALLKANEKLKGVAVDIDKEACQLTAENASLHKIINRLEICNISALDKDFEDSVLVGGPFDVIISNPPYIPTGEIGQLDPEVQCFESHSALDGGEDGMKIINAILQMAPRILQNAGSLWLEVGNFHAEKIATICNKLHILQYVKTHRDFCQRQRFCHIKKPAL